LLAQSGADPSVESSCSNQNRIDASRFRDLM